MMTNQRSKLNNVIAKMDSKIKRYKETIFEKIEKRKQRLIFLEKVKKEKKSLEIVMPSKIIIKIKGRYSTSSNPTHYSTPQPTYSTLLLNPLENSLVNNSNYSYKKFKIRKKSVKNTRTKFFDIRKKQKKTFDFSQFTMQTFLK